MRFGFFDQLPRADWQSESQRYEDILSQIELGDALGLDTAWLGELHFIPGISCLPSPLMVLSAAAQRTKRIRLVLLQDRFWGNVVSCFACDLPQYLSGS